MPNQTITAGAQPDKPSRYATIYVSQIFTGYWSNSSQFRDSATSFVMQKFYSATRNDSIRDGANAEMTPRMSLARRFGHSIFDSSNYTDVDSMYAFKPFQPIIGEQVIVLADEGNALAAGTNATYTTNPRTLLVKKSVGAGPMRFLGVNNTLFMSDGIDNFKWSWFPAWTAATAYPVGSTILDIFNNFEQSLGYGVAIASTSVTSNVLTVNYTGAGVISVGDTVEFYGLTTKAFLNLVSTQVLTAGAGTFTVAFTTANYGTTADTGVVVDTTTLLVPTSDATVPAFTGPIQNTIVDGTMVWINWGNSVQNWGIVGPTVAPTVANVLLPTGNPWSASTYFWTAFPLVTDTNNNIQLLTTAGTTGGSVPTWNAAILGTTTDGSAIWTNQGTKTRAVSHAYVVGQFIEVTWTGVIKYVSGYSRSGPIYSYRTLTYNAFFQCTTAGTSSSVATSTLNWSFALGAQVNDGTVVWTNVGLNVTRTTAASSGASNNTATGTVQGVVGDAQVVSTFNNIVDTNLNLEEVTATGVSAATVPTWATVIGTRTTDSSVYWINAGASGVAQTLPWMYTYTWGNPVTGDQSEAAPLSNLIVEAADSGIQVSGPGSPDPQVGVINIYRTLLGGTIPYLLATIPAPINGGNWTFLDTTVDPGRGPNVTLNIFIIAPGYGIVNGVITNNNYPPPVGSNYPVLHAGRIFVSLGNIVYYSTGPDVTAGVGNTSFDPFQNFYEFPGIVYRMWATTVGLYFFTGSGTWLVEGLGTLSNPFTEPELVDDHLSITSYDAFSLDGPQALAYSTDRQFYLVDPQNGKQSYGIPIGDVLSAEWDPAHCFVSWHSIGLDQRGFISRDDGSNTMINFMNVPPPESGIYWSTPATLTNPGGVKFVGSIETTPGLFTLLVGPSGTGPILKRDGTVYTDNSVPYDMWAVFGLLVAAQYGQMAGGAFIGIDTLKVGNSPALSILTDEYYGQPNTPGFSSLGAPTPDPPKLEPSRTIYNLRYWLVNTQEPVWFRYLAVRFDYGLDTVPNELFQWGLYVKSVGER